MTVIGVGDVGVLSVVGLNACAESDGLLFKAGHHLRTGHAFRESGVVFNFGGHHQLTTRKHEAGHRLGAPGKDQRFKVCPRRVDGGCPTSRSGTNDDDFFDFVV